MLDKKLQYEEMSGERTSDNMRNLKTLLLLFVSVMCDTFNVVTQNNQFYNYCNERILIFVGLTVCLQS